MKQKILDIVLAAAHRALEAGALRTLDFPSFEIEEPKLAQFGDFSTNFAMVAASVQKMAPKKIAEAIVQHMDDSNGILQGAEIAGPGFINFFIRPEAWLPVLKTIHDQGNGYGARNLGNGRKVQVEFVSANPTGPLHVGHGRGAVVGDAVANLLSFCGYEVQREYYINDSGRQIRTLGLSVYLRYRELFGQEVNFPADCYQGDYIRDIAADIRNRNQDALLKMKEEDAVSWAARFAAADILEGIRADLKSFGVGFDNWFSEQSLYDRGKVEAAMDSLLSRKILYEHDGALWFKTSEYGDEKDRVVVRTNGITTYFASDIAYHLDKFDRGFERVIDVWGADHHGYIPRMKAAVAAAGRRKEQFDVILVHLVNLLRAGEPVAMSTRSGEFVTLREVVNEVGKDAARFIFLTRHYESPLDFDLEVAKQKTSDNPVFYVQYVHARISSIQRNAAERSDFPQAAWDQQALGLLQAFEEIQLIKALARYPDVVQSAASLLEPHRIMFYLMDLAALFHAYYNKHRVLTEDPMLSQSRLYLITAVQKVMRNGLSLLGVSAPEKM